VQKYQETLRKHKEADPDFVKRKVEKSIATRKKNHGEDYTGRAKCKRTMQ